MTARERLRKRRTKEIVIGDEKFLVRATTIGEVFEVEAMQNDPERVAKIPGFIASVCLLEDDGSQMFSGPDDPEILLIPVDTLQEIALEVGKLSRAPSLGKTVKN